MDVYKALELSKKLAVDAGLEIMKVYNGDFSVEYKEDESPLTIADRKSNDIIIEGIGKVFPGAGVLSEESEDDPVNRQKEYCFIIDPLDGTKEFIKKSDEFTVNIGLAHNGKVIMGVIYVPVMQELYYASYGHGAFCLSDGVKKRLKVSEPSDKLRLVVSKSHMGQQEEKLVKKYDTRIDKLLKAGSSLKGCLVAAGQADAYYRFGPTMEWDTAAMQIICEEAGAIFKQMDDTDMTYNRENHLNEKGFYVINNIKNKLIV